VPSNERADLCRNGFRIIQEHERMTILLMTPNEQGDRRAEPIQQTNDETRTGPSGSAQG